MDQKNQTKEIKLMAINASPKLDGQTAALLEIFVKAAIDEKAAIDRLDLYTENIPFINGKLGKESQELLPVHHKLLESDGLVIATPTYWFNVPAILKNFIDNLTILEDNGFLLEGKVAGFIVYSPEGGELGVLASLALPLNHMGMLIPPYATIFYRGEHDSWVKQDIPHLAKRMIEVIRAEKNLHLQWDW